MSGVEFGGFRLLSGPKISPSPTDAFTCHNGTMLLLVTVNVADIELSGSAGSPGITAGRGRTTAAPPNKVATPRIAATVLLCSLFPFWFCGGVGAADGFADFSANPLTLGIGLLSGP